MQGLACVAVIILMLFSSTAWACAESDICIVQSHTASITCSCISLVYVFIWCFFGRKISVSDRNNNWPSMHGEKMVNLTFGMKPQVLNEKILIRKLVLKHHRKLASFRNQASKHSS